MSFLFSSDINLPQLLCCKQPDAEGDQDKPYVEAQWSGAEYSVAYGMINYESRENNLRNNPYEH